MKLGRRIWICSATKPYPPEQWNIKRVELLVELLHKMAQVLDYDFDKTHIKNSSYMPMAHGNIEDEQKAIRAGLIQVLEGKLPIPMTVVNWPKGNES